MPTTEAEDNFFMQLSPTAAMVDVDQVPETYNRVDDAFASIGDKEDGTDEVS